MIPTVSHISVSSNCPWLTSVPVVKKGVCWQVYQQSSSDQLCLGPVLIQSIPAGFTITFPFLHSAYFIKQFSQISKLTVVAGCKAAFPTRSPREAQRESQQAQSQLSCVFLERRLKCYFIYFLCTMSVIFSRSTSLGLFPPTMKISWKSYPD